MCGGKLVKIVQKHRVLLTKTYQFGKNLKVGQKLKSEAKFR